MFTAHLLLAVVLTLFLALQVNSLVFVLRRYRAGGGLRPRRATHLVWTTIPVVVVLALCARSWVALFDLDRPAVASAVSEPRIGAPAGAAVPLAKEPRAIP